MDYANCQHDSTLIHFLLEVKFVFIWRDTQDMSYTYSTIEYFGSVTGYKILIHVHCMYIYLEVQMTNVIGV